MLYHFCIKRQENEWSEGVSKAASVGGTVDSTSLSLFFLLSVISLSQTLSKKFFFFYLRKWECKKYINCDALEVNPTMMTCAAEKLHDVMIIIVIFPSLCVCVWRCSAGMCRLPYRHRAGHHCDGAQYRPPGLWSGYWWIWPDFICFWVVKYTFRYSCYRSQPDRAAGCVANTGWETWPDLFYDPVCEASSVINASSVLTGDLSCWY